ncbi:MAG: hypothetical protein IJK81_02900 [Selenomonadaceae bacterium]|nr:hypothetical protein [Selenomonadaceae bacterium]
MIPKSRRTALFTFDFTEELALQQLGTEIIENFAFSAATIPARPILTVKPCSCLL